MDITNPNINMLDSFKTSPKELHLTVVESEKMEVGKKYTINSEGLIDSLRLSKDGCVYAGTLYSENTAAVNDILLPQNEEGLGKRHFMIKCSSNPVSYSVKDLGDGLGTFMKIISPTKLKSNAIISFGEIHMVIFIEYSNPSRLTINFISGPKTDEKL